MYRLVEQVIYLQLDLLETVSALPEEQKNGNVVDDSVTRTLNKIGITGIASAFFTIVLGLLIIIYPIEWEHFKLHIGLYLLIVGVMNIMGYVFQVLDKKKENIYIETETLKTK